MYLQKNLLKCKFAHFSRKKAAAYGKYAMSATHKSADYTTMTANSHASQ